MDPSGHDIRPATGAGASHILSKGRENAASYETYWRGMDTTRRQKSALTTTHVPPQGALVVDIGSGTGATTFDLASLYPGNMVVGIDIDPRAIERASTSWQRGNLEFRQVDGSVLPFEPGTVSVFHNSSVLHEFASYSRPPFDLGAVRRALDAQVEMLQERGLLIVRDFVIPRGPEQVVLEVRSDDGVANGAPGALSTAALLERFLREFRCSTHPEGCADAAARIGGAAPGAQRYVIPLRLATEFILRKDYTDRWIEELPEEYLYLSQSGFEEEFNRRGLRVNVAREIHNPWIVEHRFEGQIALFDLAGRPLPHVPTNFFIVGEKVPRDEGVRCAEAEHRPLLHPKYLSLSAWRCVEPGLPVTGVTFEVVARPAAAIDTVPFFEAEGRLHLVVKQGYPRPILNARLDTGPLDHATTAGYIIEPISAIVHPGESSPDETALRAIRERANIPAAAPAMARFAFFSSPGGIDEQVNLGLHRIDPIDGVGRPHTHYSNLSTSGTVRPLDVDQLLRSYQVGGMFEARIEVAAYLLLHALGRGPGEWIGPSISLGVQGADLPSRGSADPLKVPERLAFAPAEWTSATFLDLRVGRFLEYGADGTHLGAINLEYVVPRHLSNNTISTLPIVRTIDGPIVALEVRDLPVPQLHTGSSAVLTVPAFRMPKDVSDLRAAAWNTACRLGDDFGLEAKRVIPLGGKTFLSPGIVPEVVYPHLVEVEGRSVGRTPAGVELRWMPLEALLGRLGELRDLQTIQLVARAAHALGLWR